MGKHKSTRRGGKPKTGPRAKAGPKPKTGSRQAIRRQTTIFKPGTAEQRRVAAQAPGGKGGRRPLDVGIGAKYAGVISLAIVAVVVAAGVSVTSALRKIAKEDVIDGCVDTARGVALAARSALERAAIEKTGIDLHLDALWSGGGSRISPLLSVVILDRKGVEVLRKDKKARGLSDTQRFKHKQYANVDLAWAWMGRKRVIRAKMGVYSTVTGKLGEVVVVRDASRIEADAGSAWFPLVVMGAAVLAVAVFLAFMLAGQTGEEMGKVDVQMRRMSKQLRGAKEMEKEVERFGHDLDAAREIQANLLPPKIPQIPGYDIFPFYRSAREVGGDYYDFFPIDKEHLAIVVADVSGKGVPGSMVMATTRTLLRMLGPQAKSAPAILQQTNAWVAKDIKRGMFVTALFTILNVHTRQMTVCSAGHNPMVVFRERTGQCEFVNPNGIALGFDRGPIFDRTLQERRITLESGDRVVMYTDGVVEAMNSQHDEYGDERFYEFVRENARMRSKDFVLALVRDLDAHKGDADQHDDITIATLRVL